MVAFEIGHYLKRKRSGRVGQAALKVDMLKAYDHIECDFLQGMMVRLGFNACWISLIRHCVTLVQYNVVHNGEVIGPILPKRGLRQKDPLSPYLFIFYAEGLSILLQESKRRKKIHGCKITIGAPLISHLFFYRR